MQITLSFDNFTELPYTSGTIQNISSQATVEICQEDTVNTGLILGPGEWFSWSNSTVYARSAWDYEPTATCAVVPFKKGGEGGGSEYILPVATKSTLGGVKSSDEAGAIKVDSLGKMTYNAPSSTPLSAPDWETNTAYPENALVEYSDNIYICLAAHTSGTFADDLANGKWKLVSMTLTAATSSELGGVKSNSADGGVTVNSDGKMNINLPKATPSILGGVKVGDGLSVTADGTLSATGGGGGIGSYSQITRLDVSANTSVDIDVNETLDFNRPPIEILKFQQGTQDIITVVNTFVVSESAYFDYNDDVVVFDNDMYLKTQSQLPTEKTILGDGYIYESQTLTKDDFSNILEVSL